MVFRVLASRMPRIGDLVTDVVTGTPSFGRVPHVRQELPQATIVAARRALRSLRDDAWSHPGRSQRAAARVKSQFEILIQRSDADLAR
jgi:hypothetical protein